MLYTITMESPIGQLRLFASEDALVAVYTSEHKGAPVLEASAGSRNPVLAAARRQLAEFFEFERSTFDLPLGFEGTPFQRAVWAALCEIPLGATVTYAELARRLGRPSAARAIGAANARNPISIIAPCHRVIGADGSLTGYAGGLAAKRWLLAHEAAVLLRLGAARSPRPDAAPPGWSIAHPDPA